MVGGKKNCKVEAWFVFVRMQMCTLLISHQRAESSKPGSRGGSRRSIFTSICLLHSFLPERVSGLWWDHSSVSLLPEGTPCSYALITQTLHVGLWREQGWAFTGQEQRLLWSHFGAGRNSQRHIIKQLMYLFYLHFLSIVRHAICDIYRLAFFFVHVLLIDSISSQAFLCLASDLEPLARSPSRRGITYRNTVGARGKCALVLASTFLGEISIGY